MKIIAFYLIRVRDPFSTILVIYLMKTTYNIYCIV